MLNLKLHLARGERKNCASREGGGGGGGARESGGWGVEAVW